MYYGACHVDLGKEDTALCIFDISCKIDLSKEFDLFQVLPHRAHPFKSELLDYGSSLEKPWQEVEIQRIAKIMEPFNSFKTTFQRFPCGKIACMVRILTKLQQCQR